MSAAQRLSTTCTVAAIAAVTVLFAAGDLRAEEVRFRSAQVPVSPLRARLAQERGEVASPEPAIEISGGLYRPGGNGPFPALVVLHGCRGRSSAEVEADDANRFTSLGYVALYVDSFKPRGIQHSCVQEYQADRATDAVGALEYLAAQNFVRPDRIAVVGASQGGGIALTVVSLNESAPRTAHPFAAAVAYYPTAAELNVYAPTLILVGEFDNWTKARSAQERMRRRTGEGAPVRLIVYPGAHHGFSSRQLAGKPEDSFGRHLEYNEAADTAALRDVTDFLKQTIGR